MHNETYLNVSSDCHGDLGSLEGSQNRIPGRNIMMAVFKNIFCALKKHTIGKTMEQIMSIRTRMHHKYVFNKLEIFRVSDWSVGQK